MRHGTFKDMQDEMFINPNDLFIVSNSKHAALCSTPKGEFMLIRGDFSGSEEECEAEMRRILDLDETEDTA